MTTEKIEGLGEFGYTGQTVTLARQLQRNPEARAEMRKLLDMLEQPHRYSNEDFDRRQHVAATLSNMMRDEVGMKVWGRAA